MRTQTRVKLFRALALPLLGWLCACVGVAADDHGVAVKSMNPAKIMAAVRSKYSSCQSYSDQGSAETIDLEGNKVRLLFKTYFVVPSYFRFDWQDWSPARSKSEEFSTLRSDSRQTYLELPWNTEYPESVSMGVAAATGCSAAAASIISPLLMEVIRGSTVLDLAELNSATDDVVDGVNCYVVTGVGPPDKFTLWVSKSDFSLMRVRRGDSNSLEEAKAKHEFFIDYHFQTPQFDKPIPQSTFKFPHSLQSDSPT